MEKEQNLYEVTELNEYDRSQGYQPYTSTKSEEHIVLAVGKSGRIGVIVVTTVILVVLLALLILQIAEMFICPTRDLAAQSSICNCSLATTANNISRIENSSTNSRYSSTGPNCSIVYNEWTDEIQNQMVHLQTQVSHLINTSDDTAWKIDDIRNTVDTQTETNFNYTRDTTKILETTEKSAHKLMNIASTLSVLQDTCFSTAGVADDILLVVQELLQLHNDSSVLPTSCQQIKQQQPNSPTGAYVLAAADGTTSYNAYCNMGQLCGSGGGWTRLAYLDMSSTTNCPSGFRLYQSGGVRACGRPVTNSGSCASVQFPSNGISYSQVCGRVVGYQWGTPDGLHDVYSINSYYVDGVSITRGSPRQHVWTLIGSGYEIGLDCPCSNGASITPPSFVGNNYFCESANPTSSWMLSLLTSDPLWDGNGCNLVEVPCCSKADIPWFHRNYGNTTTTDYLELRVCSSESTSNEDIPVSLYEIYVK